MKLSKNLFLATILAMASCATSIGQKSTTGNDAYSSLQKKQAALNEIQLQRWSHLDALKDTIPGMSVDKAYAEVIKNRKGQKVIVGVIDSGVDVAHDDLQAVIWKNPKEIAGNGIDDDKNGYVDDIHGWNFLGDAVHENLELVRVLKTKDDGSAAYKRAQKLYDEKKEEALQNKQQVDLIYSFRNIIADHLKKNQLTVADIEGINTDDQQVMQAKMIMQRIIEQAGPNFEEELNGFKEYVDNQLNYNLNMTFDGRKPVGDNPNDINDRGYGNNNVVGPDPDEALHGTHVAGIIAQVRNNNLGGDGIADQVEIMALRAVPNGDEYDKDIALAIRYAVDQGAKVINGSFGKSFSPQSQWVWDAMKYAESKDVLIVHAAGNDGLNLDSPENPSFPTDTNEGKEICGNVLTIGALNHDIDENLVAPFSNYGKTRVDVFAPGMKIYATIPGNKYKYEQGTSMASPNAAGVAALVRSYYPSLTAKEVKQIIMNSGTPISFQVKLGEDAQQQSFSNACKSGKIVNAYQALLMAEKMTSTKKGKS